MTDLRPLAAADHHRLRFDRSAAGATRQIARIGLSEIAFVAADMPLCLAKDVHTGRFNLVALMGLVEPANLFAFGGGFQATYVPRAALLTGFRLDANGLAGLAVDSGDPTIGDTGEPLFDQGAPSPLLDHIRQALTELVADVAAAQTLIDRVTALRLIRPLALSVQKSDGQPHDIAGLYTVDDAALRTLADDDVIALHRADALAPLALMSASLAQLERLRQLHNARFDPRIERYHIG